MHIVTFTYEREGDKVFVFADLEGFHLWSRSVESVIENIVPLVQHLFWRNDHILVEPKAARDFEILLSAKTMMIEFEEVPMLQAPEITLEGMWWIRPGDEKNFFVPVVEGKVSQRIMDRVLGSVPS